MDAPGQVFTEGFFNINGLSGRERRLEIPERDVDRTISQIHNRQHLVSRDLNAARVGDPYFDADRDEFTIKGTADPSRWHICIGRCKRGQAG